MATYKVIQDIEAEDKLVGPLTLRQCIYAAVACLSLYICFLLFTKGAAFLMIPFLPIAAGAGFFAFPWQGEQPTEIWALARLRYILKPRVRIWDQDGMKDLVTVLVPKKIEQRRSYKDSLSQREVRSRLKALANTIDSRGWATRNAAYGITNQQWTRSAIAPIPGSTPVAESSENDIFDPMNSVAQNFDAMLAQSSAQHRQRAIQYMNNAQAGNSQPRPLQQPAYPTGFPMTGDTTSPYQSPQLPAPIIPTMTQPAPPQDPWFANGPAYPTNPLQVPTPTPPSQQYNPAISDSSYVMPAPMPTSPQPPAFIESDVPLPVAATPTPEDARLSENIRQQNAAMSINYDHLRVLQPSTPDTIQQDGPYASFENTPPSQSVTHTPDPAILEYANNDDLDIATIARQVNKQSKQSPDEVEIRLH